ncbi:DUF1906 domain-containing protein [Corynebacterium vitaeruminis]|uniref:DUF1906 domain-containing protein n=1 Tax=Corynebacterium vitaeruminis TaxID=38305 RepID=UPI00068A7ADE|nr:DUF1906 domain-containing protein [Corynebacterium vitaeruminis]
MCPRTLKNGLVRHLTTLNRRRFLQASALALGGGALMSTVAIPRAQALGAILGTVIDFSAGVPSASAIKAAGHMGAVRYVSKARASWMLGKPVTLAETTADAAAGLSVASIYQYGKEDTADWKGGAAGAAAHAAEAIALHVAAGGPTGRPIYVAIDDNPTENEYTSLIKPYLQGFNVALSAAGYSMGVYGNYNTIDWCIQDGLGSFFWQHDWGSNGQIHPSTTIHQKAGLQEIIDGVTVDVNHVYASDWGQWTPGQAAPAASAPAASATVPPSQAATGGVDASQLQQISSYLPSEVSNIPMPSQEQINAAVRIAQALT